MIQLKHEIRGKAIDLALDRLDQSARLDTIQTCKRLVEHDLVPTNREDAIRNALDSIDLSFANHSGFLRSVSGWTSIHDCRDP
jgi:hypothetical protein